MYWFSFGASAKFLEERGRREKGKAREQESNRATELRDKGNLHICHKKYSVWALALKAIRL